MTLKKKYQSQQTAIASYDYTDINSGTGYSVFYGVNVADGTTSGSYILTDNAFYSDKITTYKEVPQAVTKFTDLSFDVQFNKPQIMGGDLIVSVPIGIGRKEGITTGIMTTNISGSIVHYDGTTETTLGTFRSTDLALDDGTNAYKTRLLSTVINISELQFKAKEILRVYIEGWSRNSAAVNRYVGIGHDPKNRPDNITLGAGAVIYDDATTTYGITTMEVHVPFKIDI